MQQKFNATPSSSENTNMILFPPDKKAVFLTSSDQDSIRVGLMVDTVRVVTFTSDYFLFPLILELKKFDAALSSGSEEIIYFFVNQNVVELENILESILLNLKKDEKILLKKDQDAQILMDALNVINELLNYFFLSKKLNNAFFKQEEGVKKFNTFFMKAQSLILNFFLNLRKKLVIKCKKVKMEEELNDFLCNFLTGLSGISFYAGYYHQAQIYLNQAIAYLEKMKISDRSFELSLPLKVFLVKIYFKFGYCDSILNFIKELDRHVQKKYFIKSIVTVESFLIFLIKEAIPFYREKNNLIVLEICQRVLPLIGILIKKGHKNFSQKTETLFKNVFTETQKKYCEEFKSTMKASPALKKMVSRIEHNFNQASLLIVLKTKEYHATLLHTLRYLGIQAEGMPEQGIKVNLYACTGNILAAACEKALNRVVAAEQLKEREESKLIKAATELKEKHSDIQAVNPVSHQESSTSHLGFFAKEKASDAMSQPTSVPIASLQDSREQPSVSHSNSDTSISASQVSYHFPKTRLTYHAHEANQGKVTMLTSEEGYVPEGIYFAYIPDYILDDPHYLSTFSAKLVSGKIGKHAIRWITKEMQLQGESEHYLFKMVISNRDPRLYAWVEEVIQDAEGKKHFLLCFGILSNHKLKNLPSNPQKFKDKMDKKYHQIQSVAQQSIRSDDQLGKFLNTFVDIIYDESIRLPESCRVALQDFLTVFIQAIYQAKKTLNDAQCHVLLTTLDEVNICLQKLATEEGKEQALVMIDTIVKGLSGLKSSGEKNYLEMVTPLLTIFERAKEYYANEARQSDAVSIQEEETNALSSVGASSSAHFFQETTAVLTATNQIENRELTQNSSEKEDNKTGVYSNNLS